MIAKKIARKQISATTKANDMKAREDFSAAVDDRAFFVTRREKRLADITAADVPPGLDPEHVASDYINRKY